MSMNERKSSGEWIANGGKSKQTVKKRQEAKVSAIENGVTADVCKNDKKDFRFKEPQVDKTRKRSDGTQKADKCMQTVPPVEIQLDRLFHSSLDVRSSSCAFKNLFADEDQVRNHLLTKLSKELTALCESQPESLSLESEKAAELRSHVPTCCKK
ncbi:hypothetical protein HG537_0C00700 [Torulaspora globosa]|uniref:Uncharacterized protein n=1 Tax=Torulaspora globosa TaxID=48254 RepID=A0A7H9HQ51_9SACH|nr:hypothetical protein HG537_0C00700 [Torulaspora sp. CBS 2947]